MPGMNMIMSIVQNKTLPNLTGTLVKTKAAKEEAKVAKTTAGTTTMSECRMLEKKGTVEKSAE